VGRMASPLAGCSDYLLPNCRVYICMNYSVRLAGASKTNANAPHALSSPLTLMLIESCLKCKIHMISYRTTVTVITR